MNAELSFPDDVHASLYCDYRTPPILGVVPRWPDAGVTVIMDKGTLALSNFPGAHFWHTLTVKGDGSPLHYEKAYTFSGGDPRGEDHWTT